MKLLRVVGAVALLGIAAYVGYRLFSHPTVNVGESVAVYYTKGDGASLARWNVSLGPARDRPSVAFYAAVQAVAGPPPDVPAIRFPAGTVVRAVDVKGSTASVDLDGSITTAPSGSLAESGEFKALVWTLTALPGIDAVQVRVDGARVPTLPGGHLELDEPLTRQSW
ncbi:MAG: GerMN domain-containing protein [Candidatus Eremiobacteraeota bacterium]|nr:GerMN domain-containing protein [Candidatus Eremiobacteraeota bacterium]MBC5802791.1 GerMN domain-containing protein [Candidatus Eremiobacteraeota bacterium]MBC5820546.1 GerMN domain-containing protein [Candidatus Eremiobacteraeota bacterium]